MLRERIAQRRPRFGRRLPAEQALLAEHSVSRITVRRALAELEREGLIDRRRGAGTFVTYRPRPKPIVADIADVLTNLIEMGRAHRRAAARLRLSSDAAAVAEALGSPRRAGAALGAGAHHRRPAVLPPDHACARAHRRHLFRSRARRPAAAGAAGALRRARSTARRQEISAVLASPEVAAALEVRIGSALIALTRVVYRQRRPRRGASPRAVPARPLRLPDGSRAHGREWRTPLGAASWPTTAAHEADDQVFEPNEAGTQLRS